MSERMGKLEVEEGPGLAELRGLAAELEGLGANLTFEAPGLPEPIRLGANPEAARVVFRTRTATAGLAARDHLALGESFLAGEIEIEGDAQQVMAVTELASPDPSWRERAALLGRLWLRRRSNLNRESIAFHYDRPPEFFLPWFDRWRSYSHGFYTAPDDDRSDAQARKMQHAIDVLGLKPGMHVFDMGGGWGSFVEYAGLQGIHVHAITISREQHRFVQDLIDSKPLPCTVEFVDFLHYRPARRFDGAVFMGTFEHFPAYDHAARFLARYVEPEGGIYADFCTARGGLVVGAFLRKYLWPGVTGYVDLPRLTKTLLEAGFHLRELADDTLSYACTVRDWGRELLAHGASLESRFGRREVRAFQLFLWASEYFLTQGRTQAYHLVAHRKPAPLRTGH